MGAPLWPADDLPCSAYACARACALTSYPDDLTSGSDAYKTMSSCILKCPGVSSPSASASASSSSSASSTSTAGEASSTTSAGQSSATASSSGMITSSTASASATATTTKTKSSTEGVSLASSSAAAESTGGAFSGRAAPVAMLAAGGLVALIF